jgi:nucleoside-diphosphate-sugar epimerase
VQSQEEATLVAAATTDSHGQVDIVIGDISRPPTARRLFHGLSPGSTVVHTAGVIHPRRVSDFTAVNADGTRHMLHAASEHSVRRFVHVSSNSPLGTNAHPDDVFRADEPYRPYLGYGQSKMLAELAVAEAASRGLDTVVVRPPWFYGPFQPARQTTFFKLVRRGRFPVIGDGSQRRSMVFVENLVDGILLASSIPAARGRTYWIADERPYEVREIVETVGRALRDEGLEVQSPGRPLPAVIGALAERADRILQSLGIYQQQLHVLGEMDKTIACDISQSTVELGYQPAVALYEGMRRSIRWCLDTGVDL